MVILKAYQSISLAKMKQVLTCPVERGRKQGTEKYRGGEVKNDFTEVFQKVI